jgi:hypothetical protein
MKKRLVIKKCFGVGANADAVGDWRALHGGRSGHIALAVESHRHLFGALDLCSLMAATLGGPPVMPAAVLPLAIMAIVGLAIVGTPVVGSPMVGPAVLFRIGELRFVPQLRVALTGGSGALHLQVSHQGIQGCRPVRGVRGARLCVVAGGIVLRGNIKHIRKVGPESWWLWLTGFILDGGSRLLLGGNGSIILDRGGGISVSRDRTKSRGAWDDVHPVHPIVYSALQAGFSALCRYFDNFEEHVEVFLRRHFRPDLERNAIFVDSVFVQAHVAALLGDFDTRHTAAVELETVLEALRLIGNSVVFVGHNVHEVCERVMSFASGFIREHLFALDVWRHFGERVRWVHVQPLHA